MATSLTEFEVGYDRTAAFAVAEQCRALGYEVELRLMDSNGNSPGLLALAPHRLIAHAEDERDVGRVVHEWETAGLSQQAVPQRSSPVWVRLIAAFLAVFIIATLVSQLFG